MMKIQAFVIKKTFLRLSLSDIVCEKNDSKIQTSQIIVVCCFLFVIAFNKERIHRIFLLQIMSKNKMRGKKRYK